MDLSTLKEEILKLSNDEIHSLISAVSEEVKKNEYDDLKPAGVIGDRYFTVDLHEAMMQFKSSESSIMLYAFDKFIICIDLSDFADFMKKLLLSKNEHFRIMIIYSVADKQIHRVLRKSGSTYYTTTISAVEHSIIFLHKEPYVLAENLIWLADLIPDPNKYRI